MVQLKPEIYNMIVESMLATDGPFDHNTKLDQQQSLARMMQASEVSPHPFLFTKFFEEGCRESRHMWKGRIEVIGHASMWMAYDLGSGFRPG